MIFHNDMSPAKCRRILEAYEKAGCLKLLPADTLEWWEDFSPYSCTYYTQIRIRSDIRERWHKLGMRCLTILAILFACAMAGYIGMCVSLANRMAI